MTSCPLLALRRRVHARSERGATIVLVVAAMVTLLGISALVIDLGNAWYARRALQASTDAAALAAAQDLPSYNSVRDTATTYLAKNAPRNLSNLTTSVTTRCLASSPLGCTPVNAAVVRSQAVVHTSFARLFGLGDITVSARSTACQPCGAKGVDIMFIVDRSGSMNDKAANGLSKLDNLRTGIKTFLGFFDPGTTHAGLALLPAAPNWAGVCDGDTQTPPDPGANDYYDPSVSSVIVPLSSDWKNGDGTLNTSSHLASAINCIKGWGRTSYSQAVLDTQAEMAAHARPGVAHVVVFVTDGAANTGPNWLPANDPARTQPCHAGVTAAGSLKAAGATVYTIGYGVDPPTDGACTFDYLQTQGGWTGVGSNHFPVVAYDSPAPTCAQPFSTQKKKCNRDESPAITPVDALTAMATDPAKFYNMPSPDQLNTIFTQLATDISTGSSRLVDSNTP
jgi:Flp pilus assembly protein TadG